MQKKTNYFFVKTQKMIQLFRQYFKNFYFFHKVRNCFNWINRMQKKINHFFYKLRKVFPIFDKAEKMMRCFYFSANFLCFLCHVYRKFFWYVCKRFIADLFRVLNIFNQLVVLPRTTHPLFSQLKGIRKKIIIFKRWKNWPATTIDKKN